MRFLNFIFPILLLFTHSVFADNASAGVYDLSEISGSPRPCGARDDAFSAPRHGEEAQPTRQSMEFSDGTGEADVHEASIVRPKVKNTKRRFLKKWSVFS